MLKSIPLNEFTLAGLLIGPILGSGLLILPALLFNSIGKSSLIIWGTILGLGFVFAILFGKLSMLYPGEGGVSLATGVALGVEFKKLTSFYLIGAVLFGPAAVALISGEFIHRLFPAVSVTAGAALIMLSAYLLLLIRVKFLGKVMLFVSSIITILFIGSALKSLLEVSSPSFQVPMVHIPAFGHSFLVAFWAIVGWEVIGSYSREVGSERSFLRGVVIAASIISLVYILVVGAICLGSYQVGHFKIESLIEVLFGQYSLIVLTIVSSLLCIGTLILFVGSTARLVSSLNLTPYTSTYSKTGIPLGALNVLTALILIVLALVSANIFTLESLVAIADGFFLSNALIGLVTAIILFKSIYLKITAGALSLLFLTILLFSNGLVLITVFTLLIFTLFKSKQRREKENITITTCEKQIKKMNRS